MSKAFTFDRYFKEFLLLWEGTVYENVPGDPGGPTKLGIDQRSHPTVNIRALTEDKAKEIYRSDYWRAIAGDQLQTRTAWAVMDSAVNCGVRQAVRWLQRALDVPDDGRLGPVTLSAAAASPGQARSAEIPQSATKRSRRPTHARSPVGPPTIPTSSRLLKFPAICPPPHPRDAPSPD